MINPEEARAVPKEHHDLVCENLAKNIKEISKSNLVDNMAVYARVASKENPNIFAYKELYNKNSNKLANTATIDKYIFGEKKISIDNGMGF